MNPAIRVGVLVAMLFTACAPSTPGSSQPAQPSRGAAPASRSSPTTITLAIDEEIKNVFDAIAGGGGSGAREFGHVVNQYLVAIVGDGSAEPRALAELPSIDRGTWKLLPDGTMETTWKIRPNITWHDGTPFTPQDVIFSWQVNKDPDVPNSNQVAVTLIDRMEASDATTVTAHWKEPYPYADRLEHREMQLLPRHLLERSYIESKETFLSQPYFSNDFVGIGPYRVRNWERGSHVELAAFDGYFLGRPKIDTVRVQFIPDQTTLMANLRAKSVNVMVTLGSATDFDGLSALKQEWEAERYGTVYMDPISWRFAEVQQAHGPKPTDLTDPRVRRALLTAIDRPELARGMYREQGVVADSWIHPSFPQYRTLQDSIARYPYDPSRALAMLAEAGWQRGPDGVLTKGPGQRWEMTIRDDEGEKVPLLLRDNWKAIGIDGTYEARTVAALRDREDRATYTGVSMFSNPMSLLSAIRRFAGYNVPYAENRWTGTNRGGYTNAVWDSLEKRAIVAMDDSTRVGLERELVQTFSADLPALPLFYRFDMVPNGGVTGVKPVTGTAHTGFIVHTWNIHEWDVLQR